MDADQINTYLAQSRELIGIRSQAEIAYDDAVVAHLSRKMDIKSAICAANAEHPNEALKIQKSQLQDVADHYDYLIKHKEILRRLGIKER